MERKEVVEIMDHTHQFFQYSCITSPQDIVSMSSSAFVLYQLCIHVPYNQCNQPSLLVTLGVMWA